MDRTWAGPRIRREGNQGSSRFLGRAASPSTFLARRAHNGDQRDIGFGDDFVTTRLTIDRFEGDKKQIAVLLTDGGDQINFPKTLLPKGAKAGDILSLSIE